jgi:hypothetical protein
VALSLTAWVPYRSAARLPEGRRAALGLGLASALGIAFAWGPAIDLVLEILWTARGSAHGTVRIGLALVAVLARFAIARFAFRATTALGTAVRLAVPTLVLGVALRLAWLWSLLGAGSELPPPSVVVSNLLFPPVLVALYAALLAALLRPSVGRRPRDPGRAIAVAALWVVLAQATRLDFGISDPADWCVAFLGLDWAVRFAVGTGMPLLVSIAAVLGTAAKGTRLPRLGAALGWWLAVPVLLFFLWIVSAFPLFSVIAGLDVFVIAAARTPNGGQLVLTEAAFDPYDVLLSIRRPGESWTRLRLVRAEPLWDGRIDVATRGTTASLSAFDVVVATVDWQSGAVTHVVPMTWFKSVDWQTEQEPWRPLF